MKKNLMMIIGLIISISHAIVHAQQLRILNFYGDSGFRHLSQPVAVDMIEKICTRNNWEYVSTKRTAIFNPRDLATFDVVVFNNNCGNEGQIFNEEQQEAFRSFIHGGGGFVGIHCAGAIWNEGKDFQQWYQNLLGTTLIDHPPVQDSDCIVEIENHPITKHLPKIWKVRDEYHRMSPNPRGSVQVLLSVNENSYQGKEKMHGDHPLVWTHLFDGGKSFFSSLGHTDAIYNDGKYIRLIEEGIRWVAAKNTITPTDGLQVDLDADKGVVLNSANRVTKWFNQASNSEVKIFESNSTGRTEDNPGQPFWKVEGPEINWHRALFFNRQELVSQSESCFDALVAGSGYTWLCVLRPGQQLGEVKDVNSFFGNLKNGENYEGFWAGLNNDNTVWMGSRNGRTFGRWDQNNPKVESRLILDSNRFHLLIGRMEKGTQKVRLSLFVNNVFQEAAFGYFPVDLTANASKLVIGQERDAIDHPGKESFIGSIARFMLFDRALSDKELSRLGEEVGRYYGLKILFDTESSRSDKRK